VPRIRTVKHELFEDEALARCQREARLLFVGLIAWSDDYGNQKAGAALLRGHVFPYDDDVTVPMVAAYVDELEREGMILRYEVEGECFLHLNGWAKHQRIDNAGKRLVPRSPAGDDNAKEDGDAPRPPADPPPSPSDPPPPKPKPKAPAEPSADEAPLAHLLADLVAANHPNRKRPKVSAAWASAERLLLEKDLDGLDPPIDMEGRKKQVRYVIEWTQKDDFERGVMRSMPKLRARYDDLVTKAADHYRRSRNGSGSARQSQKHERVQELLERGKAAANG
jgi:hypothetical protein